MIRLSPFGFREYLDRIPTTDLYFLNPLAELRRMGSDAPRIRHLSANVYLVGRTGVVVRYGGTQDIERLSKAGARRIVYIADDDFAAGLADPNIPEPYRLKLKAFVEGGWPGLTAAADIVIVPGTVLAEIYGAKARIIPPAWDLPPASSDHFAAQKRTEIVHLGTGSHRGDLALLVAPLTKMLERHGGARLTLFAGGAVPGRLRSHHHLRLKRPRAWWRYKRALPKMRFHLALYPLASTAFNKARSANKLFEHAIVGAASLMSPNPALREAAGDKLGEIFVEGGMDEWAAEIETLIANPDSLRQRVDQTRAHVLEANPLARAASAWREILEP
jgi:hypothetical protein